MSSPDLIYQGLELAVIGMGTVFTFLTVLVGLTALMSWCVRRFGAGEPAQTPAGGATGGREDDGEVVAAIAAALRMHRARR